MAYKLQLKRGASGSLPTGSAGEPLFTTDTNDLYIGTGGANQRFQKYIASGTSAQFLKGDGSLDSTTYTPTSRTLTINGTSLDLSANRTFNVGTVTTAAATTGGQVAFFNGATVITSVSGLYFDGVDKLGIGTASPTYNLDVTGTARMTGNLTAASIIKSGGTSTQYLMADGSTSTLTNPVTGTGTTNYLPKWTSGSAIGNSTMQDDGTNVSITGGFTANSFLRVFKNGSDSLGSGPFMALYNAGATAAIFQQLNALNGLDWWTTFGKLMTLTSSGNLLVNSSTDNGNRLQVTGNGYFSGNVGIGTSTPAKKLDILSINSDHLRLSYNSSAYYDIYQYAPDGSLRIVKDNGTSLILTQTNNLGLGVVPSAWSAGSAYELVSAGNAMWALSNENNVTQNAVFNAGWKYGSNGLATRYQQQTGLHMWWIAPSGTAGNAITFTQAMTLDASGNLGLGLTNMSSYNAGGNQFVIGGGGYKGLTIAATTEGNIYFADGTTGAETYRGTIGYNHTADYMYFFTLSNERARITSGGNLLVGTTTDSGQKFQTLGTGYFSGNVSIGTTTPFGTTTNRTVFSVNGTTDVVMNVGTGGSQRAYLYASSTYADLGTIGLLPLIFSPNNIEQMRIKSNGIINLSNVPSSATGLSAGDIYKDASGFLKIV